MPRKTKEETVQVAFRLPKGMVERIDAHAARLTGSHPGLEFVRVDAVRSLLARALDDVEGEPDTKRRGRS